MTSGGKRVFSHEEAFPELGALALGALSQSETDAVEGHVAQCSICTAELAVMCDAAGSLASAVSGSEKLLDSTRSARLRAELVARARLDAAARTSQPITREAIESRAVPGKDARSPIVVEKRIFLGPILATALAASIVFGFVAVQQARKTSALQQANARLFARVDSLESEIAAASRMIVSLAGREVKVFDLTATGITAPSARMFWDVSTDRWTLFAHDLPALAAGKTYQLWLVTGTKGKVSAGAFTPSATGGALVQAEYALSPSDLQAIAVTEEPAPGVAQPTGPTIISGGAR